MNYNDPKTTEMYVDFLWQTVNYWRNIAAANKEELDYYRDLVKALVNGEMDIETLKELEGMKSSMDWIVWEMLEKLKADKKILIRAKNEARVIYETSDRDSKQYWRGLLRGYERQIVWTQDNIDKLNGMIKEEQRNDEAYDDDIRQLRLAGRGYIYEDDGPEPTGGLWGTETGDVY